VKPIKILLILENAGAGSGRHVVDLAKSLLDKGHSVNLVYSASRLESWFEEAINSISGLNSHQIEMCRGPSFNDLKATLTLRRYIKQEGPFDIIHGHSSKGGALARLAGFGSGAKVFYTPHAFYTLDPTMSWKKKNFYRIVELILSVFTDKIICVSEFEHRHAVEIGLPKSKLIVVHNGLGTLAPPNRTKAREMLGLEENEICIGFVGRIAYQKALERLIRCFSQVYSQTPNSRLVIVGSGPEEAECRAISERLGVDGNIIWTGQADGPKLMAGFDVFALPSRYEAFPYVLLEAGARGLPIVTTCVGGADEIVCNGESGYVVSQDDLDGFTRALVALCKDPDMRKNMGIKASEHVEKFNISQMVGKNLEVYASSL